MEERRNVIPEIRTVGRVSWGSIFAGTLIALVVQFTLIMLGFAIGFGTLAVEGSAIGGVGIGAAVWWILSSIIALFAGGWVSSRLAGIQRVFDGFLHGLVTWSLVTLVTVYFLTSGIGAILGGAFGVVSSALSLTAQGAGSVLPQIIGQVTGGQGAEALEQEIRQALGPGGEAKSQTVINEVRTDVQKMLQGTYAAADRQRLVNTIVNNSDMTRSRAQELVVRIEGTVQQLPNQIQQAQETAQEVAAGASKVLSAAAVASFIMLILTAAAAGLGGWVGRVRAIVEV